jgi:hypothetical protein
VRKAGATLYREAVYDDTMRRLRMALVVLAVMAGCGGGGGGSGPWRAYAAPGTQGVTAVWAFAPDDVWAGSQIILHFDGTAFAPVVSPPLVGFVADFLGFAPDDLYAVAGVSLLHWDGAAWSVVSFADAIAPSELQALWGTSGDDLWLGDSLNGQVFHWNGAAWSTSNTMVVQVRDLWGSSDSDIYAGGQLGISHWNGSGWSAISDPLVENTDGVWGFGTDDVWAVGEFGTLAHWDGSAWTEAMDGDFPPDHLSVWGAAPDDVWTVGFSGDVSHWNGARWSPSAVGTFPYYPLLNKVHGSSASNVWAVGLSTDGKNSGVILRRGF